jgi:hypothetical protein
MIENALATEFIRSATSGRTTPPILTCESDSEPELELFCKLSQDCEQGVVHLAREVIAACLAADLGLPVPQPYLVTLSEEFVRSVTSSEVRNRMQNSSPICFGSTKAPAQFSTWLKENRITTAMQATAASIFLFDGIIQNADRREVNPNCLSRGEDIRIFDHDLCFATGLLLGWQPPWVEGSLENLRQSGSHIFFRDLVGQNVDFEPMKAAWRGLSDHRIEEYVADIPKEWSAAKGDVQAAVDLIRDARDRIDECVTEIRRVLT